MEAASDVTLGLCECNGSQRSPAHFIFSQIDSGTVMENEGDVSFGLVSSPSRFHLLYLHHNGSVGHVPCSGFSTWTP